MFDMKGHRMVFAYYNKEGDLYMEFEFFLYCLVEVNTLKIKEFALFCFREICVRGKYLF